MKLAYKVAIAPLLSSIVFGVFGYLAFNTLETLRINGSLYNQIIQGKDVIADVLPPPEYILEGYLVVHQISTEGKQAERNALCSRLESLKNDYMTQHEHWSKELKEGKLKDALVKDSYSPAVGFFRIVEEQLIPAAKSGDMKRVAEIVNGSLKEQYEAQRKAVDEVVKLANERNADDESQAKEVIHSRSIIMLSALLGGVLLMLASTVIASIASR